MTREKAIEVLENGAWWDLLIPITTIEGRKSDIELHEALDIAIAALRNGWISVEDRLPEDGKYLCCFSSLGLGWCIDVLSYASDLNSVDDWDFYTEHHGGFYDLDSEYGYYEISGVAYWRPLPEPPEEE